MILSKGRDAAIRDGDLVLFYITPEDMASAVVKSDSETHNRLGRFKHDSIIGKPFGSKIYSSEGKAYMHVLRPSTDLWTRVLPHRTQIIYHADMAFIMQKLDLRVGSIVVESGTGSGSFTHNLAKTVFPSGRIYTFDFHEQRAALVREQFLEHGMQSIVVAAHRDVCKDGFGLDGIADAVFLDLPAPWDALAHAKQALRKELASRVCCYSPCIEQVQRTIEALSAESFVEIEMYSCLLKEYEVRRVEQRPIGAAAGTGSKKRQHPAENSALLSQPRPEMRGHTSFLTFARLPPTSP